MIFYFLILLSILFFRLLNVYHYPPFVDEALYGIFVSWFKANPGIDTLFAPIENGFAPFFIWISSLVNLIFNKPIISQRIVSLIIWFLSSLALFQYLKLTRAKRIFLPIFIFLFNPFVFLYSQTGLMEMILLFVTLLFFLTVEKTTMKPNLVNILLFSFSILILLATKFIGLFMIPYALWRFKDEKVFRKLVIYIPILFLTIVIVGLFIAPVAIQFISLFKSFSGKFILSSQILLENFREVFSVINSLDLLIVGCAVLLTIRNFHNKYIYLITWLTLGQAIFFIFFAVGFYPRYLIYFVFFPVIVIAQAKPIHLKWERIFALIIMFIYLASDLQIWQGAVNENRHVARKDKWQFASGNSSSGREVMKILSNASEDQTLCTIPEHKFFFKVVKDSFFTNKKINIVSTCKTPIILHNIFYQNY